ncbi:hypothetical protein H257_01360 [Aphanomyces astaci]|uniref:Cilia- and flagella-associated protein 61 N-terminal domain-containing protein n=1 Tax=Aphanomyces astaci TaxID=112090 RepID=W4H7S8_APHAT|nr:hypothetical protein H257_01360 [Aphanomyces astaci]ETV87962.1 hypothetical protein H257_01360 [Aphanomyces astaci]|eukprot:XP_009822825.1 hypothetical protein H257_01360 [Aphanomyces astaci]
MDALTIRRAQASDAADVGELDAPEKTTQRIMYGRSHANMLIEASYLALTAETSTGEIVGFMSVNDQPPGDLCEEVAYLEYLCDSFALENHPTNNALCRLKVHTTLFLTYFVYKSTASASEILPEMLSTIFHLLTSMELVVFPAHNSLGQAELAPLLPHFHLATKVNPNTKGYDEELFAEFDVLVCPGDAFLPSLVIRKANIEDHDDLEPILKAQNQALVDTFGDYFLAELIGSQTAHNMCLVAQPPTVPSRAVGIMAISDEVDLGILRDCFDLSMYNNLVKPPSSAVAGGPGGSRLEKILKRRKSPKMIMFGPPASGKTTQVDKLLAQYGLVHLTINVLLRVASRMSHPTGKKVKRHLDKHEEVPDEIVLTLLADRIHESDCITQGWVLDGYPTTEAQAQGMLQRGIKPDVVVLLEVSDEEVAQRLVKVSAGMETKPRLKKYHDHAPGILKCLSRDQALITIDGTKDKEVVTYSLIQALSASDKTKLTRQHKGSSITDGAIAPPTIVICGPPAGGKGTQCELLVKQYGVVHLSTGDILRAAIKTGSDLGIKAQTYMNAGELVPDEVIIRVVLERINEPDCQRQGWLLDGFPRTEVQAQTMVVQGIVPQLVIVLDVPDGEVIKRISGRRVDVDTGKTYHLIYNPPPPELKDKVTQRADDTEETIKVRLGHYHTNCGAIVKTFTPTSIVLAIDGMQAKDKITQEIAKALAKPVASDQTAATASSAGGKPSGTAPNAARNGPPKLIICGPPAGGKGTQCELLVQQYGVVHLSTGDILRAAIQAGSEIGLKAKSFMDAGELVPDDLIIRVIVDRLDQSDCQEQGWLLDGFPRTEVQAHAMIGLGIVPDLVIVLEVPATEVIKRISGRRVDVATGKTYHLVFNPPPPNVNAVQRSDDTEETIKVRLSKYNENCGAVVRSFSKTSRVLRVDGMQGKDKIAAEIHRAMEGGGASVKHEVMPPKLIICGPPAGGKGTQCEQLVKKYGVVHLSTGDILRDAVKAGTDTGVKAKKYMDMGELVPDELIMDTILDRLGHVDCVQRGWLLDGFPRNESQARSMVSFGILPDMVLVLDVPDEDVIARISGRRVDPVTGKTYHVTFNPPPPDLKVVQRSDDTEATVRIRLKSYHLNVNAVLKVFTPLANVVQFDGRAKTSADMTTAILSSVDDARALVDVEGNAFLMTLFCIDDAYLVRSTEFLRFAFSLFPHKEYCVVTVAPLSTPPLVLASFTLVPPKPSSTYSHCLYLLHRDALSFLTPAPPNFSLDISRFKLSESFDQLAPLVETLPAASIATLEDEMALAAEEDEIGLEDNPKHVLFVARVHGVVVALASLARDHEVTNSLKHYFDMEQLVVLAHHRVKDQAILTHWVLNPIYACAGRVILKEVMRHFKKTCLFACIPPQAHVSPLIVDDFVLALPRRQIALPATSNQEPDDPKKALFATCALYFFTKRLFSEPKLVVNTRLVVVGASDTGLTLLKRLLHVPYARFTHVTLVSPHGLNVFPSSSADLHPFLRPSLLTPTEVDQYGLPSHVRVVVSRVVQIDRVAKAVVLVDNSCLPYDYLVLATGLTDGTPTKLHLTSQYDGDTYVPASVPTGVHTLHDAASARAVVDTLKLAGGAAHKPPPPRVVVSGSSAFALSVLQGVVALNVTNVTWLKQGTAAIATDMRVLEVVGALMQRHKITVLDHHELSSLVVNPRTNALEGLNVVSTAPVESPSPGGATVSSSPRGGLPQNTLVPCEVLLCCSYDDADYDAFRAINECGLVYDGRLVVNSRFQTTDPCIYAGGSLCRFSRRFPQALYQQHYSARECGELLAASLLHAIDPLLGHAPTAAEMDVAKKTPPPKFTMPKVFSSVWMEGMQYVHINLPDVSASLKSLTTEHADGSNYCCLQFDEFGVLATLTYLGTGAVEVSNLQCVVGLHEAYLNCAISSFQQNLVSDWISFFREAWASAIYHDRFQEFCVRLNTALKYDEGIRIVVEAVKRHVAETGDLKEAMELAQAQAGRGGKALMPTTKKMIELNLLDYLSANREVLNMYFLPRAGGGGGNGGNT